MTDPAIASRLLPHERVVWSSRPATGIRFTSQDWLGIPVGLFMFVFSIVWITGARSGGAPTFFWMFGIPFVAAGLYAAVGRFVIDAWARGNTRYAITDRRVLIVRGSPAPRVTALALDRLPEINLSERADGSGTITFGPEEPIWGHTRDRHSFSRMMPSFAATPAFLFIPDARHVFDRLQPAS